MIFKSKDMSDETIYINMRNVEFIKPAGEENIHIFRFTSGKESHVRCRQEDIPNMGESHTDLLLKEIREEIIKNRAYLPACNI